MVTGPLKIIPDSRIRDIVSKGPEYRCPSTDVASALNDFGN